jgi:hypothetical protein
MAESDRPPLHWRQMILVAGSLNHFLETFIGHHDDIPLFILGAHSRSVLDPNEESDRRIMKSSHSRAARCLNSCPPA